MTTLIEDINTGVSAYPPLSITTASALKTAPAGGPPNLTSLVTSALLSQLRVIVANSPLSDVAPAVSQGAGVVSRLGQPAVFIIGNLALSPNQLEKAGVIKPGSSAYVDALLAQALAKVPALQDQAEAQTRATPYSTQADVDAARTAAKTAALLPEKIIPANLFYQDNLQTLIDSSEAQISCLTSNLDQALSALIQAGILTGEESATSIAGLLLSAVESGATLEDGTAMTISAIGKIANGQPISQTRSTTPNIFGSPVEIMSGGLYAGRLSVSASIIGPLIAHLMSIGFTGTPDQLMAKAVLTKYPNLPVDVPVNLKSSINSSPYKDIPWTMTTPL